MEVHAHYGVSDYSLYSSGSTVSTTAYSIRRGGVLSTRWGIANANDQNTRTAHTVDIQEPCIKELVHRAAVYTIGPCVLADADPLFGCAHAFTL
jgi:hypothetical protein